MAEYPKLTMTNKAIEMIAESQLSGANLEITKVKIGDGLLADGTDIKSMTDTTSVKMEAPMTSYKSDGAGQLSVNFAISNANLDAGFFAREIGIFAKLTDGEETLYAYTNAGNKCDWIPDKGTPIDSQVVEATLIIGNASSVTVRLADKAYALVQDLEDHNLDPKAHPNLNLDGFQIGDIKWSSVDLTQVGWLVATGAEVGRDTYSDLNEHYAEKGYPWGAGDGSTTFNLPNLIGKFPEGALQAGGYHDAGLPNIEGSTHIIQLIDYDTGDGAFTTTELESGRISIISNGNGARSITSFSASKSNSIYGNSDTVQPNSALLVPYVKAFRGASANSTDLEISKVANDVVRLSADMVHKSEADYVVDYQTNTDGSWYRKYKSGWLEQGGSKSVTSNTKNVAITFSKPYKNANYTINTSIQSSVQYTGSTATTATLDNIATRTGNINRKTTTGFYFNMLANSSADGCGVADWYACGMGAE